ncbi:MAG: cysteine--tRNA ligase [Rickettsiales bacterium]
MIHLFNSLSRKLEEFKPINANVVKMYVCGPTVYDYIHIGNVRCFVMYDVLYRLLKLYYQDVIYVRNITDVDDKIDKKARSSNISIFDLTKITIENFQNDLKFLNCQVPTAQPKATDYIEKMVDFIDLLVQKGAAYIKDDAIYFKVKAYDDYYVLSGRKEEDALQNTRNLILGNKDSKEDFILWKPQSAEDEIAWDSKFGKGRPGWHTECSVMSHDYLGDIDIHGGGIDLLFPHHTNELAQTKIAFNSKINYWVHTGALMVNGQKMSKSLNNFVTVKDLQEKNIPSGAIRMFFISASYRKPIDFTFEKLEVFIKKYQEIKNALIDFEFSSFNNAELNFTNKMLNFNNKEIDLVEKELDISLNKDKFIESNDEFIQNKDKFIELEDEFMQALCKDLNTPVALSIIYQVLKNIKKTDNYNIKLLNQKKLLYYCNILGIYV